MNDQNTHILQERAARLSRLHVESPKLGTESNVLVFKLIPELFAIPTSALLQVFQVPEIAHIPGMPDCVTGVFHRKGKILPAVNLKVFFNFPKPGLKALDKLLLVQTSKLSFGLLADEIYGLQTFEAASFRQPAFDNFAGCIAGIFNQNVSLLELEVLAAQIFGTKKTKL